MSLLVGIRWGDGAIGRFERVLQKEEGLGQGRKGKGREGKGAITFPALRQKARRCESANKGIE